MLRRAKIALSPLSQKGEGEQNQKTLVPLALWERARVRVLEPST